MNNSTTDFSRDHFHEGCASFVMHGASHEEIAAHFEFHRVDWPKDLRASARMGFDHIFFTKGDSDSLAHDSHVFRYDPHGNEVVVTEKSEAVLKILEEFKKLSSFAHAFQETSELVKSSSCNLQKP